MVRVLQVIGSLNNGGSQAMIMNIYRNIDRSKLQFDFIIDRADELFFADEIIELGGKIYTMPTFSLKNSFEFIKAWHTFFKEHPEYKIIHGHVRSTASIYLKIANRYGLVTIAHSHNTSSGKGITSILKNILQYPIRYTADDLFACSRFAGEWLYGKNVVRNENFFVIKNAIETDKFVHNLQVRNNKRKDMGLEGKFIIGHIGRFHEQKNHTFIIDIFKEIYKINGDSVLMLVGDGKLRQLIEEKANKMGLKDSVIFMGVRSDIPELLQVMDVFLFPSLFEGLPVTVIEAQAAGLKCFLSDTITKEVVITDLITSIGLDKSATYWANLIVGFIDGYSRKNMYSEILKNEYDIKENAQRLQCFYISKHKKLKR